MLLRRFTDFILQSRFHTILFVFLLAFIPLIGSLSILIAALVTLRKGKFEGALAVCAASAPYIIGYMLPADASQLVLPAWFVLTVVLASNILVWFFCRSFRTV